MFVIRYNFYHDLFYDMFSCTIAKRISVLYVFNLSLERARDFCSQLSLDSHSGSTLLPHLQAVSSSGITAFHIN